MVKNIRKFQGVWGIVLVGISVAFLLCGCEAENQALTSKAASNFNPDHLVYNGWAYLGDPLENRKDIEQLREFSNAIALFSSERTLSGRLPELPKKDGKQNFDIDDPAVRRIVVDYLRKEGERIDYLNSLGYSVTWSLPLSQLIRTNRLGVFKDMLEVFHENFPQMDNLYAVYFYDEPDINSYPGTKVLEEFIEAFKAVFPETAVTMCYAIAKPEYLDVVPPGNVDILSIDPYMLMRPFEHSAADIEEFYRQRLALGLQWVRQWHKPWILVGDAFAGRGGIGKKFPTAETLLWYYLVALTEPDCVGIYWLFTGPLPIERENLKGYHFVKESAELDKVYRQIGESIIGEKSPIGLSFDIVPITPEK